MDSPVRDMDMEETADDEFVLVPDAADLMIRSYHLDDEDDDADHEARFLAGNNGKTIDANYFASEPSFSVELEASAHCKLATAAACSCAESEDSVENDVIEAVAVAGEEEEGRSSKDGGEEGDHHGWQQHAVGMLCSVGIAAAATGLALLLGGHQQPPHNVRFTASGDRKAAKVSARMEQRQGVPVPRVEHAPASISFGGSYHGLRF